MKNWIFSLKIRENTQVYWNGKHCAALTGQAVYPRPLQEPSAHLGRRRRHSPQAGSLRDPYSRNMANRHRIAGKVDNDGYKREAEPPDSACRSGQPEALYDCCTIQANLLVFRDLIWWS
jgi:hypothetical protein